MKKTNMLVEKLHPAVVYSAPCP